MVCGISVICHGNDVWGARPRVRQRIENHLLRRPDVRVVAVSSFTAGALAAVCRATVLPPGLSQEWFDTLVGASDDSSGRDKGVHIVSAFRLGQWRGKGLPELLAAIETLGPAGHAADDLRQWHAPRQVLSSWWPGGNGVPCDRG